jgi:hypothetical protein
MARRTLNFLAVLGAVLAVASIKASGQSADPVAPATTKPATRRGDAGAARAEIQETIAALTKEVHAALRQSSSPPRTQSDYFTENPSEDVTPEAVAAVLLRRGDGPATVEAYLKWQLMSALPETLEDPKIAAALLRAYRSAPPPYPRPGVEPRDRARLDKLVHGTRESERQAITEEFERQLEQFNVANGPVLAYRDELLERLPPSYETYAAAFGDSLQRLEAGLEVADHVEMIAEGIRSWAMTGNATPRQLADLLKAVRQLKNQEGPQYYDRLEWNEKARRLTWYKQRNDLNDGKHLDDLVAFLTEQVKNPPGSLNFGE